MNKNINLCEILKGHEGETFYNPLLGNLTFKSADGGLVFFIYGKSIVDIPYNGLDNDGNISVFPSKHQRDWNKWDKENNTQTPKTWSELSREVKSRITAIKDVLDYGLTDKYTPIEKSAFALLKIHQLIEVGYGGNVTNEEWNNCTILKYVIIYRGNKFCEDEYELQKEVVAFHTSEQRKEFLKYPENIQLLKDYYMI